MKLRTKKPESAVDALREILISGVVGTQETLIEELEKRGLEVTQSTVSRSLQKLSAVKTYTPNGEWVYKLQAEEALASPAAPINKLITQINYNDSMIVIRTSPGSASLVARHLDLHKPSGIIGTVAGDDTIFVAPPLHAKMKNVARDLQQYVDDNL